MPKSEQQKATEILEFEKILKEEEGRTAPEKFSYKKIATPWLIAVSLIFLVLGVIALFSVFFQSEGELGPYFWVPFLLNLYALATILSYNGKWEKHMKAKRQLGKKLDYSYLEYIHTDSSFEKNVYAFAKVFCYLFDIAAAGLITLLLFSWLGSITIAPTTIIIILLLVIAFK
jgi:hypothetical protein